MKSPASLPQLLKKYQILAFTVPFVLLMGAALVMFLGIDQTKQAVKKRQELAKVLQTNSQKAAFNQFVATNQLNLENVNRIVPNEAMMISVIQDFEKVVTSFDPEGTVKISSANPTKVGVNLAITLTINAKTPLENLPNLLSQLNQLPYMVQLLNIDTNRAGDSYHHQLNVRLYVQDPFNSP